MRLSHLLILPAAVGMLIVAILFLLLSGLLLIECLAALARRSPQPMVDTSVRAAVLIPAHNEAICIHKTLECLVSQVSELQDILVVADNCTDDTAEIARSFGVSVVERSNPSQRGKGYALDYGLKALAELPPDVVVIVDADCLVQPGAVGRLVCEAIATQRPVQATYLMEKPAQPSLKDAVSAFAFKVKNLVRLKGLRQLGLPCSLTGTGMAFPWQALQTVDLASSHIVEDMKLGLDLAIAGYPPTFCPEAQVLGQLPQEEAAAKGQRTRWEHGHLQMIKAYGLPTLATAIRRWRFDLLVMGLDLCIPPLSLLVVLWAFCLITAAIVGILTSFWWPLALLAVSGSFIGIAILSAWLKFGRSELSFQQLISIPLYIAAKVPLYLSALRKPQAEWVKTKRDA
ncbi:MAG: glycosyltransferase [Leptolyngbya sp. SIO4C5]|nr:glycosyltransferase [Leptolyngbya sp. SIO4C5]